MLINIYQQGSNSRSNSPRNRFLLTNNTQLKQTDGGRTARFLRELSSQMNYRKNAEGAKICRDLKNTATFKKNLNVKRNIRNSESVSRNSRRILPILAK